MKELRMEEILRSIAGGAGAQEMVDKVLGLAAGEQEKLIQALGAMKKENAASLLSLLYPSLADKKLRKLVKKELFLLKTQGIRSEEPRMPGNPP